jgi:hypothetical protein
MPVIDIGIAGSHAVTSRVDLNSEEMRLDVPWRARSKAPDRVDSKAQARDDGVAVDAPDRMSSARACIGVAGRSIFAL